MSNGVYHERITRSRQCPRCADDVGTAGSSFGGTASDARTTGPQSPFAAGVLVLGSLLAWGHRTGWTIPKFSSLTGHADDEQSDWCSEHNVPESQCVECNPDLLPKPKCLGWCNLHGVHDCPFCHPEVAQVQGQPQVTAVGTGSGEAAGT